MAQKLATACHVASGYRSYTGEALEPILEAGPRQKRQLFTPDADEQQAGELEIGEVGSDTKMPWQIDGRAWHTQNRVDRRGNPVRWDGRILAAVIDRIHELGEFSETNWDSRSVVEISAVKKSDGWFMHAITAETWLLKLKFRVTRNTFKRTDLQQQFNLKTLNEMDDLPVYGNEPRVKCRNLRGPFQEIELRLHSWAETDTPEFWQFLEQCVAGFNRHTERVETNPEDIMPWKKLGERWHLSRKGFPPGKRVTWPVQLLEELFELLREKAEDGQFLWNNQQVVRLFVPGQKEAWASVVTKRATHVELILSGPKGGVALGRVAELGRDREIDGTRDANDFVRIEFHTVEDLQRGDLAEFLEEHISLLRATAK